MRNWLIILTILFAKSGFAQENYCHASVSHSVIGQNERFKYEITTDLDCEIVPPDFSASGFIIVSGPMQGTSTSYTNLNGRAKTITEHTLSYYLIGPEKGSFIIPPAVVKCKNKTFESESVKVTVSESNAATSVQDGSSSHFIRAIPSKEEVYEGEAFTVLVKFYSKKRPSNMAPVEPGTATPMFRENLFQNKPNYTIEQERVDGEVYYVIEMYKDLCIPLGPGTAEINPYYAALNIGSGFFGENWIEAYSNKVEVKVKKLPEPQPANFNGLIGQFDLIHSISKTSVNAGEVIDLNLSIQGTGNLNAFDDPEFNFPEQFHVFDPEVNRNLNLVEQGFTGEIEYHFVISPDEKGKYILPPYSFSYFDPVSKSYKSLTMTELQIEVGEGAETHIIDNSNKKDPTQDDIHYISEGHYSWFTPGDFLFGSVLYWVLLLLPISASVVIVQAGIKKSRRSTEQIQQIRQKEVKKTVIKDFKIAHQLAASGDQSGAVKSAQQTLVNYFMVKFNLSMSSLSKNSILNAIQERKLDTSLQNQFSQVWDKLEMAQYAPVSGDDTISIIKDAESLVRQLNQSMS